MIDPARTYVDTTVELAPDVRLLPGHDARGPHRRRHRLGDRSRHASSSTPSSASGAVVRQTVARESEIGDGAHRRPVRVAAAGHPPRRRRARRHVRRDQELARSARAPRCRTSPTSATPRSGRGANIGAGTITANYDGKQKHRTKIGADARTGSNTVLVAPVEVGDGAYTGAGAVVNRDVPPGALAKGVPARIDEGWVAKRDDDRRHRRTRGGGRELMELVSKKTLHALRRAGQPRSSPRRSPSASKRAARRREAVDASRTASSTAATARASAAPTCSSAEPLRADQRPHHGAADHDRRRQARVGASASPRCARSTATPARTARPRAASRSPRGSLADLLTVGRRRPRRHRRPAHRPDPGLLRRPGRPPHRGAAARRLPRASRSTATSWSCRPTPAARKLARRFANCLEDAGIESDLAFIDKRRPEGHRTTSPRPPRSSATSTGASCVLIDDMIDTAGTIVSRRRAAHRAGRHRRCGCWPPTACCRARPSTG